MNKQELQYKQSLPLQDKIDMSMCRIEQWYGHWDGQVFISFSGGLDSTVLLHLVRSIFPEVPAVFFDTGLEYPEIREFVRTFDNVEWIRPKHIFRDIIDKYGYPVISKEVAQKVYEARHTKSDKLRKKRIHGDEKGNGKIPEKYKFMLDAPFEIGHKCCYYMKKSPSHIYMTRTKRYPYLGTRAEESSLRYLSYVRNGGCNAYGAKVPSSSPLSFWMHEDVVSYLDVNNLPYSKIYDMGYDRTGCMFCMFGVHMENEPNRFQRMKETHPKQYGYCMDDLGMGEVLDFIGVKYK